MRAYLLAAVPLPENKAVQALPADGERLIDAIFWKDPTEILENLEYGEGVIQVENASIKSVRGEPWINVRANSNYNILFNIYSPEELEITRLGSKSKEER